MLFKKNTLILRIILHTVLFCTICTVSPNIILAQDFTQEQQVAQVAQFTELTQEQQSLVDQFAQEAAQEIDAKIVTAINQTKKIDAILEELAQIIQNGLIKTDNKTELISQIKSIRKFISQIISDPFELADTATVNFILDTNKNLLDLVNITTKTRLQNVQDINLENLEQSYQYHKAQKKSHTILSQDYEFITQDQLELKARQNHISFQNLEKSIATIGLSWTNLAYRNLIIEPIKFAQKYNLFTIAKWSLCAAAVGTYALYRFTPILEKYLGKPATITEPTVASNLFSESLLKQSLKPETVSQLIDGTKEISSSTSWFANIETKIYTTKKMAITKLLIVAVPFLLYDDLINLKDWSLNKLENLHYKLIGGTEEKKYKAQHGALTRNIAIPRYTFKDVAGLDYIKKDLKPLIEYIKNSARFERVGIGPEKGYVFVGKPGTGKSFMAEALAGQIAKELEDNNGVRTSFKFIPFEASQIYEIIKTRGVSDGIDAIMSYAKQNAPCIVFIDEIDLLGLQRTSDPELLSKLLNAISGFLSNNISENIIMLVATNKPDNLDPALLRRGRLGKIIHFEYPTSEARRDYIEKKLNPIVTDLKDFDINKLARETDGCTFEAIQSVIRKAFQETKINGGCLDQNALESALNQEIRQILPEDKNLSQKETQMIAACLASNALANILLDTPNKLACVTINPVMGSIRESAVWEQYYKDQENIIQQGKLFTYQDHDTANIYSKQELLDGCKILLAGSIGQEILLGKSCCNYNKNSTDKILKTALLVATDGLSASAGANGFNVSNDILADIMKNYYKQVLDIIQECKQEVRLLLENNKANLEKIYKALLENKILDATQVHDIINNSQINGDTVNEKI